VAERLAADGAHVVGVDRAAGATLAADVSDEGQVDALYTRALDRPYVPLTQRLGLVTPRGFDAVAAGEP